MIIGVDLRSLQIGHQYRGIGEVAKQTLKTIFEFSQEDDIKFQLFIYECDVDPLEFIDTPPNLDYELINMGLRPDINTSNKVKISRILAKLFGNPIKEAKYCDVFLQFDFMLGVPTNTKSVLIKHDVIPLIFKEQYFTSPLVHVRNKAARTTLRTALHNFSFKRVLNRSIKHANTIVAVSESTKNDLIRVLKVKERKINVIPLGVTTSKPNGNINKGKLPSKPYLLFVGAVDGGRRSVVDIIDAYNNLKAKDYDIQLALVGENFDLKKDVLDKATESALKKSSYRDDILTPGYVNDVTKVELFKNATAFVFPTHYEGFGIPVLEAMSLGCPVITYSNSSIPEVAGDAAIYVKDWTGILEQSQHLLGAGEKERAEIKKKGLKQADKFSWKKTGTRLYEELTNLTK